MKANIFLNVLLTLFVGVWLYRVGHGIARQIKEQKRLIWLVAISGLVLMIGAGGIFATMFVATGAISLRDSFEWPSGYVRGVVETSDGKYLVPVVPAGRLQVYDSNWHFLRGWQVDANGGSFTVDYSPDNEIVVSTSRVRHRFGNTESGRRYAFTETGKLISEMSLPISFVVAESGEYISVPTWRLLWIFSSPFLCWGFIALGSVGLWAADKLRGSKPETNTDQSV
jgi:WD40 repeat protein